MNDITNKDSQNKIFFSFNFAITKFFIAIRLAEDGTRMSGIQFRLSPSIIINGWKLLKIFEQVLMFNSNEPIFKNKTTNRYSMAQRDFNNYFYECKKHIAPLIKR